MTRTPALIAVLLLMTVGCADSPNVGADGPSSTTATTPRTTTTIQATPTSTSVATTTSTTLPATPTTEPGPPHLTIIDPPHKGVVTTANFTFRGSTDPGCTVSVGDTYLATVHDDGTWELDLTVPPGRSSTTVTATNPDTGLETSESIRVYYVLLQPDGLGIVKLGDPADQVVATMTEVFGPPDVDSTVSWEAMWDERPPTGPVICDQGFACHDQTRVATWNDIGLYLAMSDLPYMREPRDVSLLPKVGLNLIHYGHYAGIRPPDSEYGFLTTAEGIGPGSTVEELLRTYGSRALLPTGSCGDLPEFTIEVPDGRFLGSFVAEDLDDWSWDETDPSVLDASVRISSMSVGQYGSC